MKHLASHAQRAVTIAAGRLDGSGSWTEVYKVAMAEMPKGIAHKRASKAVVKVMTELLGTEDE